MTKNQIITEIEKTGVIAILRGYKTEEVLKIGEALLKGGVNCMEITYIPKGDYSLTANSIQKLNENFGKDMYVGAGTVLFEEQVEMTKQAGGKYIISPNVNEQVIKKTVDLGLISMPGALTPTECENADLYGADFVKLFPMSNMGVEYFKAISAPLSHIKFLAVGGVGIDNLGEYFKAGVKGIGVGGSLGFKDAITTGDYSIITKRAEAYIEAINKAR